MGGDCVGMITDSLGPSVDEAAEGEGGPDAEAAAAPTAAGGLTGGVLVSTATRPPLKLGTTNLAPHSGQIPRLPASSAFTCSLCPLGH
jgi:hypothetical protein